MSKKSFIFCNEPITCKHKSLTLIKEYKLKKANKEQIKLIKQYLNSFTQFFIGGNINRFEIKTIPTASNAHSVEYLREKDWNYWIIEFPYNYSDENFNLALALSDLELFKFFECTYVLKSNKGKNAPGFGYKILDTVNFIHDHRFDLITYKIINKASVKELNELYNSLNKFDLVSAKYSFIKKALMDFQNIHSVSNSSPFRVLSYISIIELLITSQRSITLNGSSLNNQVKKKLNLLNNRFKEPIDTTNFFAKTKGMPFEKVIEKLYDYRSDIAHGNQSDFKKKLLIFKGETKAIINFLHKLTKMVLIEAINEPKLLNDLKEC